MLRRGRPAQRPRAGGRHGAQTQTNRVPAQTAAQSLINSRDRDFLFSEIGLGGGDPANQRAAASLEELAGNPLYGIWAVYNTAQDPWRNSDYKSYRRMWFK